jgi:hypothetical protein
VCWLAWQHRVFEATHLWGGVLKDRL